MHSPGTVLWRSGVRRVGTAGPPSFCGGAPVPCRSKQKRKKQEKKGHATDKRPPTALSVGTDRGKEAAHGATVMTTPRETKNQNLGRYPLLRARTEGKQKKRENKNNALCWRVRWRQRGRSLFATFFLCVFLCPDFVFCPGKKKEQKERAKKKRKSLSWACWVVSFFFLLFFY